jgi:branched-chain amino acid transport system substrate-binding protein
LGELRRTVAGAAPVVDRWTAGARSGSTSRRRVRTAAGCLALVLLAAGCGKGSHPGTPATVPTGPTGTAAGPTPGITASTITVGNVATVGGLVPGLFEGARYGAIAYADYVNSLGGVDGRKLVVQTGDDALSCTQNKSVTTGMLDSVVAFVGGFSLFDYCGADAVPTSVPYVAVSPDATLNERSDFFSPQPITNGHSTGPLLYYKAHYPNAVLHVGALVAGIAPAPGDWAAERAAMESLGYHISVVDTYQPLTTQFTSDVVQMQQAGVQMVVLDQADVATDARFVDAMQAQGFHPQVVTTAGSAYDATFVQQAGEPAAEMVTTAQLEALYLGTDASTVPAVGTFDHWYGVAFPGHQPDIYAVYAWASAELFVQAVKGAGTDLTRAGILAALGKVTTFDADGLLAPADPAAKTPPTCFLLAHVVNGQWQRIEPASGFDCSGGYFTVPGS